ncbi:hypothetical protein [Martelella soudanensis]|uniref:hypothetical protein n=1 Tax=unclassified Martelella TaxID=2629616 RepID=UPI0015DEF083|nr:MULTISPECIES: hypothetical protein [unclassified Martelella]
MSLKNPVRAFWQRHRALSIAFLAALILTLAFALKTVLAVYYWHNPAHRQLELKGWMTLGQVAMVHDIPVHELAGALGLDPENSRRLPLWQITRERGETLEELEDQIAEALDDHERAGDDE